MFLWRHLFWISFDVLWLFFDSLRKLALRETLNLRIKDWCCISRFSSHDFHRNKRGNVELHCFYLIVSQLCSIIPNDWLSVFDVDFVTNSIKFVSGNLYPECFIKLLCGHINSNVRILFSNSSYFLSFFIYEVAPHFGWHFSEWNYIHVAEFGGLDGIHLIPGHSVLLQSIWYETCQLARSAATMGE